MLANPKSMLKPKHPSEKLNLNEMMMKKKASEPFKKENKESIWKQMANPKEMHDKLIRF